MTPQTRARPVITAEQCRACGNAAPGLLWAYGLQLCPDCKGVAYRTCWRKWQHADQESAESSTHGDRTFEGYDCLLCDYWHATSGGGGVRSEALVARTEALSRLVRTTGFNINEARGYQRIWIVKT